MVPVTEMNSFVSEDDIIQQIRRMMLSENLNGKGMARRLGVSPSYFSEVMSRKKQPSAVMLMGMGFDPTPHFKRM